MNKIHTILAISAAIAGAQSTHAAKTINILIPPSNTEWTFATPMISLDGGKTGKAMSVAPGKCGWFSYTVDEDVSDNVVFYRNNDTEREDMIGFYGNWEVNALPTPIPLKTLFAAYDQDSLYFVSDMDQFLSPGDDGWYTIYPDGAEGICSYSVFTNTYPATKTEIEKLDSCGPQCVTDKEKLATVFGTNSASCGESNFRRVTEDTWSTTNDKHYATCTSIKASFAKAPHQKISVHNASLAWMFIDGKQATTTQGDHNGVVLDIDSYKSPAGSALDDGYYYNLEIFYCDQESSLDNIQISSNLDMTSTFQSRSEITAFPVLDRAMGEVAYQLCYAHSKANSCSEFPSSQDQDETLCGEAIKKNLPEATIRYYLSNGSVFDRKTAQLLTPGTLNKGGIDLSDPYNPKVNKKAISLPPGRWTLFVEIDGKAKKLAAFRMSYSVEILSAESADALDTNGNLIKGLTHTFNSEIVAGVPTPLYISAMVRDIEYTYLSPYDAIGVSYSVYTNNSAVHLYAKTGENEYAFIDGAIQTVGTSGIDTIYVYMDKESLGTESKEAKIHINGMDPIDIKFKAGPVLNKAIMGIQTAVKPVSASKGYAVYDMKGKLIKRGEGSNITVPTSGTYIIRTGNTSRVMKFK